MSTTDPVVNSGSPTNLGTESSLSNWAGPYVTDMLGQGQALANRQYDGYMGPLTAGSTPLQDQAFSGIAGLTAPGTGNSDAITGVGDLMQGLNYGPANFEFNRWDNDAANQYMNPYLQSALNPILDEQRRQAGITRLNDTSRLTQAGAFGGGRQAIMESELNDNTARLMNETVTGGYRDAYDRGFDAFTSDESRNLSTQQATEDSRQFGARYGLDALSGSADAYSTASDVSSRETDQALDIINTQAGLGGEQRDILQQGMDADYEQWDEERMWPFRQTQFMQSLLQGLPTGAQSNTYSTSSDFSTLLGALESGGNITESISGLLESLGLGGD